MKIRLYIDEDAMDSLSIGGGVTLSSGSNVNVEMGGTLALSDLINSSDPAAVNIDGGSLQANASFISATPIMLGVNGATVDTNSQDVTLSGPISGVIAGNGLTKAGSGTLTLSGTNSYSGATVVSAGMLVIGDSDNLPSGGSLTVASGGIFVYDPSAAEVTTPPAGNRGPVVAAALGARIQSSVADSVVAIAVPSPANLVPASALQDSSSHAIALATVVKSDPLVAKSAHTGQAAGAALFDRASVDQAMARGASWLWEFLEPQAQERSHTPHEALLIRDMVLAEYAS